MGNLLQQVGEVTVKFMEELEASMPPEALEELKIGPVVMIVLVGDEQGPGIFGGTLLVRHNLNNNRLCRHILKEAIDVVGGNPSLEPPV